MDGELIMAVAGKHGITEDTPKRIPFGAGTIHKGLKYAPGGSGSGSWNFDESIIGATNGGSKLTITPEFYDVPVDGANVLVKGLKRKVGETATMDINLAELTKDIIKAAAIGADGTSADSNYDLIESKTDISEGDYWENIAFVGETFDGRKIIAILENVICTSGFNNEGKNKEGSVGAYTFTCHADLTSDLTKLPWKIYYPKDVA